MTAISWTAINDGALTRDELSQEKFGTDNFTDGLDRLANSTEPDIRSDGRTRPAVDTVPLEVAKIEIGDRTTDFPDMVSLRREAGEVDGRPQNLHHSLDPFAVDLSGGNAGTLGSDIEIPAMSGATTGTLNKAAGLQAALLSYPDATTTGVPTGATLKRFNGELHITQDNAVISNMLIVGNVVIDADNVTMKNVKIVTDTWHALRVMDNANGFTLMDSEIDGQGEADNGVYGHGTILRTNIHDTENGMTIWGPSLVQDNYIHDLRNKDPDPHFDGIQINGGHDIQIVHNTVINDYGQTSAIIMGNTFAGLSDITIYNNRLVGGGYVVYLDGRKGGGPVDDSSINILYNQVGGGGYGNYSFYTEKPILHGNVGLNTLPLLPDGTTYIGTAGRDILPGGILSTLGNDVYLGLGGNDVLKGGVGGDLLNGGVGTDAASYAGLVAITANLATGTASDGDTLVDIENLIGSIRGDTLQGDQNRNVLRGKGGADTLIGGAGDDGLQGDGGNDTIDGQSGLDRLKGGAGADKFVFHESALSGANADRIADFGAQDLIYFETSSGQTGALDANAFTLGTAAQDSDDRFIFDTATHQLFYDSDGNGAAAKVLVATLGNGHTLSADDFLLF